MLAIEAGRVPDRQELLDRCPEHADGLRAFFADLDRLDRVAFPLQSWRSTLRAILARTPFTGDNVLTLLRQARESEPPRPSSIRPGVDLDVETVVLKCLEKDPERRYPSTESLADDLDRWLRGEPIQARPVGHGERLWRWCRRNPVVAGMSVLLVISFLSLTVVSASYAVRSSRQIRRETSLTQKAQSEAARAHNAARAALEEKRRSDRLRYIAEINTIERDYQAGNLKAAGRSRR